MSLLLPILLITTPILNFFACSSMSWRRQQCTRLRWRRHAAGLRQARYLLPFPPTTARERAVARAPCAARCTAALLHGARGPKRRCLPWTKLFAKVAVQNLAANLIWAFVGVLCDVCVVGRCCCVHMDVRD